MRILIKKAQTITIFEIIKNFIPEIQRPRYETETVSYIAPKIWRIVPDTIKICLSLESFK